MYIEVRVTGLAEAQAYVEMLGDRLDKDRHTGLVRAVNRIGDVWLDSFHHEGSRVGNWPELAESTQLKRSQQGFSPSHPILQRSGALREVVVDAFANARGEFGMSKGDGYSGQTTESALTLRDGVATFDAKGWKVTNQYDTGGHSARPMWFVDRTVLFAARSGLVDWIVNDVITP